ncbi:hypothetical protein HLA87_03010 [Mycoplasma miroungigenitalium]|uniref:ECM-binding protein homolog n=1 Tax=Mycoplasma miroungigenitalium TaxID=754515 RepID=A0A6M4J9V2_9MOLU|nr:hypothetical protein [Mycoplasma miroungigenitalium]QJR43733.1 hypothetical protein HLA87_03010 [Mycoplasma miroungigenitalium]
MKKIILKSLTTGAAAATAVVTAVALIDTKIQAKLKSGSELKKAGSITADDISFVFKGETIDKKDYKIESITHDIITTENGKKIARVHVNATIKQNNKDVKLDYEFTGFKTAEDDLFGDVITKGDSEQTANEFVTSMKQNPSFDKLISNLNNSNEYNYEFSDFKIDEKENVAFHVKITYKNNPQDIAERELAIDAQNFLSQAKRNEELANAYKKLSDEVAKWMSQNFTDAKYSHLKADLTNIKNAQDLRALPNPQHPPVENVILDATKKLQDAFQKAQLDKAKYDLNAKEQELRDFDVNNLANSPIAHKIIEKALENYSTSVIKPEDKDNIARYQDYESKLNEALIQAKAINEAKKAYDTELNNKNDDAHFGIDEKTKNEYNEAVGKILDALNNKLESQPSPEEVIKAYAQAQKQLKELKDSFKDKRTSIIDQYEKALANVNSSIEAMNEIDKYAKLQNDTNNVVIQSNKSVDKENNYNATTLENIIAKTNELNELNSSLSVKKQELDQAFENYSQALTTANKLKEKPEYASVIAELEKWINDVTTRIQQHASNKTNDVKTYINAEKALKAVLVQAAKSRFNVIKSNANKVVNNRISGFEQVNNSLDDLIQELDAMVIDSQDPEQIDSLCEQLQKASDVATKQEDFAQKYNDIIKPAAQYSNIKTAIINAMKSLKDDALSSTDKDQIQKDIDALATNKYANKIDKAIEKHDAVNAKIEELNLAKEKELNSYNEAKKIIEDAISKFNNNTIVSDTISAEVSDKNALNTNNYDNVIEKLNNALTDANNVKEANEKYNDELKTQLTESDFTGYPDAKNKYDKAVKAAKDKLAETLAEAKLNPEEIIKGYNDAQQALANAKADVEKNKAIEDYNNQVSKLNTLKGELSATSNAKKQHDNLTNNIEKAIEESKLQLNYASNFENKTIKQITDEISKLKQFDKDTESKKITVDEAVTNYDSTLTQINDLISKDIDAEEDAIAQKAKLAVKTRLNEEIKKAQDIIDAVNQNNFTTPEQKDAYQAAYESAKSKLAEALQVAQKEIEHIDQVKHRLGDYDHVSTNVIKKTIAEWTDPKYKEIKDKLNAILNPEDSKWLPVADKKLNEIKLDDVQTSIDTIIKAFNEAKVEKTKTDFNNEFQSILDTFKDDKYKALKDALAEEMKTIFDEVENITSKEDIKLADGDSKVTHIEELKAKLAAFNDKAIAAKNAFDALENKVAELNRAKTEQFTQDQKASDWIDKAITDNQVSTVTQNILDPQSYTDKVNNLDTSKSQANEINQAKSDYDQEKQNQPSIDNSLGETKQWYTSEVNKVDEALTAKLSSISVNDPEYVQKVKQAYNDAKDQIAALKEQIAVKAVQQKHREAVKALNDKLTQLDVNNKPELKGLKKQIEDLINSSETAVKAKETTPYQGVSSNTLEQEIKKLNDFKDSIDQKAKDIEQAKADYEALVKLVDQKTANPLYSAQKAELDNAKSDAQNLITNAQNDSTINAETYQQQAKLLADKLVDQANDRFTKLTEKANELIKNNNLENGNLYQDLNTALSQKISELNKQLPDKDDAASNPSDKVEKAEALYNELNKAIELAKVEKAKADYDSSKMNLTDTSNNLDAYPNTKKWLDSEIEKINNALTQKLGALQKDSPTFAQDSIAAYEQAQKDLEQVKNQINDRKTQETNEAQQAYQTSLATLDQNIANSTDASREYIKTKLESDKTSANSLVKSNPTPQDFANAKAIVDKANEFAQQQFPIADKDKEAVKNYDQLSQNVQIFLNGLDDSSPQYNKIKETLKNVKSTQDALAGKEVKPYPKEAVANAAFAQLQESLKQAKEDKTAIDNSVAEYNKQVSLLEQLASDPKYAQQSDALNSQKLTSQGAIAQAQNDKSITAQNYIDQTEALKTKIQEAAVNVYNSIDADVDKLLTKLNKNSELYKDEIAALNAAKEANNQKGTNKINDYETIAAAQTALQHAIENAETSALAKAKQAFENSKTQAEKEASDTTDPASAQLKSDYENKLNEIKNQLTKDLANPENVSAQKQLELYEAAQKALDAAKSKFIEDKNNAESNKNNEYIKLAEEVRTYLNETLTNGYSDINKTLSAVKSETDKTSGTGKNPSLSQAQSDIDKLNEAYTLAKSQQAIRAQKLSDKTSKDNLIATTKSQIPADDKYDAIKNSLDVDKQQAQSALDTVLNNEQSTTDQINNAYDAYSTALTNAINKSSKAKEFKDKYDELMATLTDSKYASIKTAANEIEQIKAAVDGLGNISNTDIKVFEDAIAKISEIKTPIANAKTSLDTIESKVGDLYKLSNAHNNNDVRNLHALLVNKLNSNYKTSVLDTITNALDPSQYTDTISKVDTMSTNNNDANRIIGSFNTKETELRNLFTNEANQQVKAKALELLNADINNVKSEVTRNINSFNSAYPADKPAYEELNDKSAKIVAEYTTGKAKLDALEANKDKYLARAEYEVAKKQVNDKIAELANQPKYAGIKSQLESVLRQNNRDNADSTPVVLREAAKAFANTVTGIDAVKAKIDNIETKLNQTPFDKASAIKNALVAENNSITDLNGTTTLEQKIDSFKPLISDASTQISSLRQSPQKTALETRLNEATTKEQIAKIIEDAKAKKQDDILREQKIAELNNAINVFDSGTKSQFAVTNADDSKTVQNKIDKANALYRAYNDAKDAINDLKPGPVKDGLNTQLNEPSKTESKMNKLIKDAKIEKAIELASALSASNPKRGALLEQLNQMKNNKDTNVPAELPPMIQELKDTYELIKYAPSDSTEYTPGTTIRTRYSWKKEDVHGLIVVNQHEGKHANKYVYLLASSGNDHIVSEPMQLNSDVLRFTFKQNKFTKDGDYVLSKVVISDSNNLSKEQVLSQNQDLFNKTYTQETSDFNIKNNGEVIANNVSLIFENYTPTERQRSVEGTKLIEAVTDNKFIINGFRSSDITIEQNQPITVVLKGSATFTSEKVSSSNNPVALEHDITINGGVSINQDIRNGNISFQFESLDLKAGYTYNLESISFAGTSKLSGKTNVYTWHNKKQQSDIITYENETYIRNNLAAESYLFKLPQDKRNQILHVDFDGSKKGYYDYDYKLAFSNGWNAYTFSSLLNYLNSKVPNTPNNYSSEKDNNVKYNLKHKWVDFIAHQVAHILTVHRIENKNFKLPTDTYYGLYWTLRGVQLGYGDGQDYNDLYLKSGSKLWPVLGGTKLMNDLHTHNEENLAQEAESFMKPYDNNKVTVEDVEYPDWRMWLFTAKYDGKIWDYDHFYKNSYPVFQKALQLILHMGRADFLVI